MKHIFEQRLILVVFCLTKEKRVGQGSDGQRQNLSHTRIERGLFFANPAKMLGARRVLAGVATLV